MFLAEELTELMSIVAEAGLPELAGQMAQYALSSPEKYWGDDTESQDRMETISQIDRAIEYLTFQLVLAESHIRDAKKSATSIQGGVPTPVMFVQGKYYDADDEPLTQFAKLDRKENWTDLRRDRVISALEVALRSIGQSEESPNGT